MTGRDGGADLHPIGNSPVVILVRPQLADNIGAVARAPTGAGLIPVVARGRRRGAVALGLVGADAALAQGAPDLVAVPRQPAVPVDGDQQAQLLLRAFRPGPDR